MRILTNIFISLFYVGYVKKWPGTFGSLVSLVVLFPVINNNIFPKEMIVGIFILIFILSIFFINYYSKSTSTHDSGIIVIDEFLGIFFIYLFYDIIFIYNNLLTLLLIFLLFRFFDILKIFPANYIDKNIQNSLGVILDDIVASIYTVIIIFILIQFIT